MHRGELSVEKRSVETEMQNSSLVRSFEVPARLLVVTFDGLGDAVVDHVAHIRLVCRVQHHHPRECARKVDIRLPGKRN